MVAKSQYAIETYTAQLIIAVAWISLLLSMVIVLSDRDSMCIMQQFLEYRVENCPHEWATCLGLLEIAASFIEVVSISLSSRVLQWGPRFTPIVVNDNNFV